MPPLFSHMGRKSDSPRLFKSISTDSAALQNLLEIEHKTGGAGWLRAVDDELTRQNRVLTLREGKSATNRYIQESINAVSRLFGGKPDENFGETSNPLFGKNPTVHINMAPDYLNPVTTSLGKVGPGQIRRDPYVQSLIDTMRHEIGGHVMENLTPGTKWYAPQENETTAQGLSGDVNNEGRSTEMTPRGKEVQRYFGIMPRHMSGDEY